MECNLNTNQPVPNFNPKKRKREEEDSCSDTEELTPTPPEEPTQNPFKNVRVQEEKSQEILKKKVLSVLSYEQIVKREFRIVKDPKAVERKLAKEFLRAQKMKMKSGKSCFGKSTAVPNCKIESRLGCATTVGIGHYLENQDGVNCYELQVQIRGKIETFPFQLICDGHGLRGSEARDIVLKHLPEKFLSLLEQYTSEKKANMDVVVMNAMKIACAQVDQLFHVQSFEGGTTATFCFPFNGYLWFGCTGDSPAMLINEGRVIPMTTDASAKDKVYADSVVKRGGTIVLDKRRTPRVNNLLAITRGFGNTFKQMRGITGHKVVTPRCKITRFPLSQLKEGHTVLLYTDGLSCAASQLQIANRLVELKKHNPNLTDRELAEQLVRDAVNAGSKDNVTVMIYRV